MEEEEIKFVLEEIHGVCGMKWKSKRTLARFGNSDQFKF
jgi:hypothetical protein